MQLALGCLHLVAPAISGASEIGAVLSAVKKTLAATDGDALMQASTDVISSASPTH